MVDSAVQLPLFEEALRDCDLKVEQNKWASERDQHAGKLREAMANPLIVDGRNLLDPDETRRAGFAYEGIGRPTSPTDVLPQTPEHEPAREA